MATHSSILAWTEESVSGQGHKKMDTTKQLSMQALAFLLTNYGILRLSFTVLELGFLIYKKKGLDLEAENTQHVSLPVSNLVRTTDINVNLGIISC